MRAVKQAPDEAFEPPIRTLGQYLDDPIEVPPELVTPYILVRGGMTCTVGRAGKGKTVMNLNRLLKWSAGLPMFEGWFDPEGNKLLAPPDDKPLKSLIIENEGAAGLFHRQVGIMLHAEGYLTEQQRELAKENLLVWGDGGYSNLKFDDPKQLDSVRAGIEKYEPDIVFVEPFRGLWRGEENSATDMAVVVDAMMNIAADYKIGVLLAHHERKSGAGDDGEKMSVARGSGVLEGVVTALENFESVKAGEQRELSWSKSRHAGAPNPVRMTWDHQAWWYSHVPTTAIEETIVGALRDQPDEPMTVADLHDATDEPKGKIREICKKLKSENRVKALPSISDGTGSTGPRYMIAGEGSTGTGGLEI
jgi:hypothetical protein